ncbi:tyrosine-protein kinase transmembrane receptor Ror-like isoform X2 [Liolophura sinensis]
MKITEKYLGETLRVRCEITGDPIPEYVWIRDGRIIDEKDRRVSIKKIVWGSRLRIENINPNDAGNYTCVGYNVYGRYNTTAKLVVINRRPPVTSKSHTSSVDSDFYLPGISDTLPSNNPKLSGGLDPDGQVGQGFCQPYRGATCSNVVANQSIYVLSKYTQANTEERLIAAFTIIAGSKDLSSECQQYVVPALCYHAFPLCDERGGQPKPRQICKDECLKLETDLCKTEYILAKTHHVIGNQVVLPDCGELSEAGTPEARNCKRIGVKAETVHLRDHRCYNGTGTGYLGPVSRTKSGYRCQNWSANKPHQHFLKDATIRNHNFCRNPGNEMDGPWCYTMNVNVQRELCDIPKCEPVAKDGVSKLLFILVPGITVPLVLALVLGGFCFCNRSGRAGQTPTTVNKSQQKVETAPLNPKPVPAGKDVPLSTIRFHQELGEGAFGKVYKGEVVGLMAAGAITKVAIKTLKENAAPKVQADFRREADLMWDMKHPNIVCLLGTSFKQQPMCMLFEYMTFGDLHDFLIRNSPRGDMTVGLKTDHHQVLEYVDMLHVAAQISAGMEYLASQHFVHRDLAARNILVGDSLTVKISDFGLSRDIYSSDYYRVQSKSLLPVRWMPPEAILYGKFTTESDVWAFGVVLWEIFSYGLQPFYGYSNPEVISMVRARQVLSCPEDCPPPVYGLMMGCWHELPARRPTFREISIQLQAWKTDALSGLGPQWSTLVGRFMPSSNGGHGTYSHSGAPGGPMISGGTLIPIDPPGSRGQPFTQGSTPPSSTTTTTALTGSSSNSAETYSAVQRPITPSPAQPINSMSLQSFQPSSSSTPCGQNGAKPKKVSPPGSTSSHPSSSSNSQASSRKGRSVGYPNSSYMNSPSSQPGELSKGPVGMNTSRPAHIPELRMSDI